VERGSSKHGPHMDEQLERELENTLRARRSTRAEEWREPETQADEPAEEPEVDVYPEGELVGGVPEGLTPEDVAGRAELAAYLGPSAFPGDRAHLIERAREQHAPDHVMEWLGRLPEDQQFRNVQEVWEALGGGAEQHRY
jgi:uncharacterized protein DUF2795